MKVFNVTASTFDVQVLDTIPSTNTDAHTFVSAIANGIKQKRDKSYDTAVTRTISNYNYNYS